MLQLKHAVSAVLVFSCALCIAQQSTTSGNSNQKEKEPANILEQRAEYFARQHGARPNKISVVPRLKALKQLGTDAAERKATAPVVAATCESDRCRRFQQPGHQHHAVRPRSALRPCSTSAIFSPDA